MDETHAIIVVAYECGYNGFSTIKPLFIAKAPSIKLLTRSVHVYHTDSSTDI